jgi:flavorubredoxin
VHAIRCLDWDRDRFDIEFGLVAGTTYNSYLIFGETGTALIDASHEKFRSLYLKELDMRLKQAGRSLDYVIVSHTEPDHSGTVPDVLAAHPGATVLASRVALAYLANLTHAPFPQRAVKAGDTVDLGGGHVLEFVPAPNLHWPDTMFTHDPAAGALFTCDAFGAHYCGEDAFDGDLEALAPHFKFYYECLMLPNARSVSTALRKVSSLKYTTIGTGHGPILRHNVGELVGRYGAWSAAAGKAAAAAAVLYCSDYGFSDRLAQAAARGITKAGGVGVEMVDLLSAEPQEVAEAVS